MDQDVKARVDQGFKVRLLNYQKPGDVHFRFYYNRHIVPHREEKVPKCKLPFVLLSNYHFIWYRLQVAETIELDLTEDVYEEKVSVQFMDRGLLRNT